jgi:hypothetical protein
MQGTMSNRVHQPKSIQLSRPAQACANDRQPVVPCLTVEQLEDGLRKLDRREIEPNLFWDQKAAAFRETVISAIAETWTALASDHISHALRAELESQVDPLNFYLSIADTYLASRRNLH